MATLVHLSVAPADPRTLPWSGSTVEPVAGLAPGEIRLVPTGGNGTVDLADTRRHCP